MAPTVMLAKPPQEITFEMVKGVFYPVLKVEEVIYPISEFEDAF